MSHRALVAVARGDDRYDVHYAHDGGSDEQLDRLRTRGLDPSHDLVDRPRVARRVTFDDVLADLLDPIEHEALVVVEPGGEVVPWVVLPYVLAAADGLLEWDRPGVALSLVGRDGGSLHPAYVRGWFQGTAGVLGESVDAGLLSPEEAFAWLDDAVRRLAGERHPLAVVP